MASSKLSRSSAKYRNAIHLDGQLESLPVQPCLWRKQGASKIKISNVSRKDRSQTHIPVDLLAQDVLLLRELTPVRPVPPFPSVSSIMRPLEAPEDAPEMALPVLRREGHADESADELLLVRVEGLEPDEFLEVVQEVGALVVCYGEEREGSEKKDVRNSDQVGARTAGPERRDGRTGDARVELVRVLAKLVRNVCASARVSIYFHFQPSGPPADRKDSRNRCAFLIPSLSNRFRSSVMAL